MRRSCGGLLRKGALALVLGLAGGGDIAGAEEAPWLTGAALDRAWQQPVSLFREAMPLRELLGTLAASQRTACLLDRRIDPSQPVSLAVTHTPLRQVVEEIAAQVGAACGRLGGTMLLGRREPLDRLLTEAAALQERLKRLADVSPQRRVQLLTPRTIAWEELDRPVEILERIARGWNLQIVNLERVPHDLWAAGTAVQVDAVEALSLVLGQFELSFAWRQRGEQVEIVPAPHRPTIVKTHRPRGVSPAEAAARVMQEYPDLTVVRRGAALEIQASVLQHEAIARLVGEVSDGGLKPTEPVPLSRRRFPQVRIIRKPLGAVLEALRQQGIEIVYDAEALRAGGVDLERLVTVELQNASVEDLFTALCASQGMRFELDEKAVRLSPAAPGER